jgi:nicotinate-nucleotide adenylyltransferase
LVSVLKKNLVAAPQIDVSSTLIRQRVKTGLDIDYLTPPAVVDYIRSKNLYKAKT